MKTTWFALFPFFKFWNKNWRFFVSYFFYWVTSILRKTSWNLPIFVCMGLQISVFTFCTSKVSLWVFCKLKWQQNVWPTIQSCVIHLTKLPKNRRSRPPKKLKLKNKTQSHGGAFHLFRETQKKNLNFKIFLQNFWMG